MKHKYLALSLIFFLPIHAEARRMHDDSYCQRYGAMAAYAIIMAKQLDDEKFISDRIKNIGVFDIVLDRINDVVSYAHGTGSLNVPPRAAYIHNAGYCGSNFSSYYGIDKRRLELSAVGGTRTELAGLYKKEPSGPLEPVCKEYGTCRTRPVSESDTGFCDRFIVLNILNYLFTIDNKNDLFAKASNDASFVDLKKYSKEMSELSHTAQSQHLKVQDVMVKSSGTCMKILGFLPR